MTTIGIDFGNLDTKVYKLQSGKPEIVFNEQAGRKIASNMVFRDDQRFFDQDATDRSAKCFETCVSNLRDWLINTPAILNPYNYQLGPEKLLGHLNIRVPLGQETKPSVFQGKLTLDDQTHLLAIFLDYLKQLVGPNCQECVISFRQDNLNGNPGIHQLIRNACQISGLRLLGIVEDTVATAIDYCFSKLALGHLVNKKENDKDIEKETKIIRSSQLVLFIDSGHASLKMSLVKCYPERLKVMASQTSTVISGHGLTLQILAICQEDLWKRYQVRIENYPKYLILLYQACHKAKQSLSLNSQTVINLDFYLQDREINYSYRLDKEALQHCLHSWKGYFTEVIKSLLEISSLTRQDITKVILTGGNTRVPYFRDIVNDNFPGQVETTLNIDESVARGCCLVAGLQSHLKANKRKFKLECLSPQDVYISCGPHQTYQIMKRGQRYPDQKKIVVPASPLNLSVKYGVGQYQLLASITLPPSYITTPGDQLLIIFDLKLTGHCQVKLVNIYKSHNNTSPLPVPFRKLDTGDHINKHLEKLLQHAHKLKQQQLEMESLTNHLEASYYQLKNKLTEDQQLISRLPEKSKIYYLNLIQERLDRLYQDRTDLEGLKAYQRELDHFYHILQGKIDYDKNNRK